MRSRVTQTDTFHVCIYLVQITISYHFSPFGREEEGCKKRLKWMLGNMLAGGFGGKFYSAPLKSQLNFLSTLWSKAKGSIDFRYVWKWNKGALPQRL